jgi:hypothetical protein
MGPKLQLYLVIEKLPHDDFGSSLGQRLGALLNYLDESRSSFFSNTVGSFIEPSLCRGGDNDFCTSLDYFADQFSTKYLVRGHICSKKCR